MGFLARRRRVLRLLALGRRQHAQDDRPAADVAGRRTGDRESPSEVDAGGLGEVVAVGVATGGVDGLPVRAERTDPGLRPERDSMILSSPDGPRWKPNPSVHHIHNATMRTQMVVPRANRTDFCQNAFRHRK